MCRRILVPLDGSRLAERVFLGVTELAGAFGSEVVIASVCGPGDTTEAETCRRYVLDKAEQVKAVLAGSAATVKTAVLFGRPSDQILLYVESGGVDLIIMSSHGRSGIARWSMGSTADKVFKRSGIPVIVVRAEEPPEPTRLFSRIVVPLDGSENSAAVLPHVRRLAEVLPCEVIPVAVVEGGKHVRTIGGLDYVRFPDQDMNAAKAATREYLDGVSAGLRLTKATVTCEVRVGEAAEEILKLADQIGCTLIAMTSHGHHGIEAWALGSVTSKITSVGRQSVWLVPSFARR